MERSRFHQTAGHIPPPPNDPNTIAQASARPPSTSRAILIVAICLSAAMFMIGFFGHALLNLLLWSWHLWPW